MSKKKKHIRKKRQQPVPKKKLHNNGDVSSNRFRRQLCDIGEKIFKLFKDRDAIKEILHENIEIIEVYFKKYDSVQLLGSVGLYLLNNLPNIEKHFIANISNQKMDIEENAEIIAEYAINFGLAVPNYGKETPTDEIIQDLRNRLNTLFIAYLYYDMPLIDNPTQSIDWMIHLETISVRGDGYQTHVYEVFKEMFLPHTNFYENQYGYSVQQLFDFFMDLEDRVICKIGSQDSVYGQMKMWERWKKWDEEHYGSIDNDSILETRDFSKGFMGDFLNANPDIPHTEDGMQILICSPNDYRQSNMIFWIYPQNETEIKILESLSMEFGDNSDFLSEGEFKGSIMNGHNIFEKPFVKDGNKYYCFTPMIPHRNLFLIAEKLMMRNNTYYQRNFQQNVSSISRDVYIEKKVKLVLTSFLPNVDFLSSVHYTINEDGISKNAELDILGVSDKAIYIIEVKAHELSYKDKVRLNGAKYKFKESVASACKQCYRTEQFICNSVKPIFGTKRGAIIVDKNKPIYKIAVTFQHYSSLLGQMDKLVESGLMEECYRDTWIVSLFDLMVVSDFIESEDEFIAYLNMRRIINTNHSTFYDELDLLSQFLNEDLGNKVSPKKPGIIIGGADDIDHEYIKDLYPIFNSKHN